MTSRYYVRKTGNAYTVHDKELRNQEICACYYREQATLVCQALNFLNASNYPGSSELPESLR